MPDRAVRRVVQLFVSCVVLGAGVALLLDARLGSDGYSMLINGLSITTGVEFGVVNVVVGVIFVAHGVAARPHAWSRDDRSAGGRGIRRLRAAADPAHARLAGRPVRELALAFVLLILGVAGYLASELGAGPTEVAALAWDPPVPFRWSYSAVQFLGGLTGWWCGADFGVGTIIVVLLIGPCVARLIPLLTPATLLKP